MGSDTSWSLKQREIQRKVEKHFTSRFPGLQPHGDLLIRRDDALLRGFAFERSQLDKDAFRLRAFVQVLSVPASHVGFGLSVDVGDFSLGRGEEAFDAAAEAAARIAGPFLAKTGDYLALADNLDSIVAPTTDRRLAAEERVHCLVLGGEHARAAAALRNLVPAVSAPEVDYEHALLARARELQDRLSRSSDDAVALLRGWTAETVAALDL